MKLPKLPTIIAQTKFDERGLAHVDGRILVPAYMGSQWGFNAAGKEQLERFYQRLEWEAGVLPLCPFKACEEYLDFKKLGKVKSLVDSLRFWKKYNKLIGPVNYETLMPKSRFMIALLDGAQGIDDGLAAEIGFYAAKYSPERPIFGIRSDFRLCENVSAPINIAVRYFMDEGPCRGKFFQGEDAYEKGIKAIKKFADRVRSAA